MANSYTDVPEIKFHMEHPLMKRIVELKERNYADYGQYDYAPKDYEDAQENYDSLLEITGDINANIIGPNSEDVDASLRHDHATSLRRPQSAQRGLHRCQRNHR